MFTPAKVFGKGTVAASRLGDALDNCDWFKEIHTTHTA